MDKKCAKCGMDCAGFKCSACGEEMADKDMAHACGADKCECKCSGCNMTESMCGCEPVAA